MCTIGFRNPVKEFQNLSCVLVVRLILQIYLYKKSDSIHDLPELEIIVDF